MKLRAFRLEIGHADGTEGRQNLTASIFRSSALGVTERGGDNHWMFVLLNFFSWIIKQERFVPAFLSMDAITKRTQKLRVLVGVDWRINFDLRKHLLWRLNVGRGASCIRVRQERARWKEGFQRQISLSFIQASLAAAGPKGTSGWRTTWNQTWSLSSTKPIATSWLENNMNNRYIYPDIACSFR